VTPVGPLHVGKYGTLFPPPTEWDALNLEYVEKDHSLESTFSRYFIVDTKTGKTRYGYDRSLQEGEVVGPFEVRYHSRSFNLRFLMEWCCFRANPSGALVFITSLTKSLRTIGRFWALEQLTDAQLEWGTVSDNYVPISLEAKPGLFHGS